MHIMLYKSIIIAALPWTLLKHSTIYDVYLCYIFLHICLPHVLYNFLVSTQPHYSKLYTIRVIGIPPGEASQPSPHSH